jgi:hypothetical protein
MKTLLITLLIFTSVKAQTINEVWNYAHSIGIQQDHIVVAQSILETGWYKCTDCSLDHNNLFGFRVNKKYLKFAHWKHSVDYYKNWQRRHYSGGDYYEFLTCIPFSNGSCYAYAEDMKQYLVKLEQILFKIWSC